MNGHACRNPFVVRASIRTYVEQLFHQQHQELSQSLRSQGIDSDTEVPRFREARSFLSRNPFVVRASIRTPSYDAGRLVHQNRRNPFVVRASIRTVQTGEIMTNGHECRNPFVVRASIRTTGSSCST